MACFSSVYSIMTTFICLSDYRHCFDTKSIPYWRIKMSPHDFCRRNFVFFTFFQHVTWLLERYQVTWKDKFSEILFILLKYLINYHSNGSKMTYVWALMQMLDLIEFWQCLFNRFRSNLTERERVIFFFDIGIF